MKTSIIISLLISPILSYMVSSQNIKDSGFQVLNMSEEYSHQEQVYLNRFVENIEFIPLETSNEAIISKLFSIDVFDDFLIIKNNKGSGRFQILLFDRYSGKFIREIGKQGRGPGEYHSYSKIPLNPNSMEVYATGASREIICYDLQGNEIRKIKTPKFSDNNTQIEAFKTLMISIEASLDNNTFCGYVMNYSGIEKRKIVVFSDSGIINIFPNFLTFKKESPNSWHFPSTTGFAHFYNWNKNVYFIETFCDTLYQVTREKLIPRYFFNWGKFNIPYSKQVQVMREGKFYDYFTISDISENEKYIFMRLFFNNKLFTTFIDKENNKMIFCKPDKFGNSGIIDNISGLMDVVPDSFSNNNEMLYIIQPTALLKWMASNPEKAEMAKNRMGWLKNIDEFSNPIVAIGKCK